MKIIPVLAALLLLIVPASAELQPADDTPVGQKAFVDLGAYYDDPSQKPPYQHALSDLASGGDAAQIAGQYLFALFQQAMADETNGRAVWKRQPFWGGGSQSPSRDFRKELAAAFADAAQGDAALPAAMWLINEEKQPEGQADGIRALRRIKSPDADAALGTIIAQPHPNEEILTGAIEEAAQRNLTALLPQIRLLENSYRAPVRDAAAKAAGMLGDMQVRVFQPERAFTPTLSTLIQKIAERVYTPVPPDAKWVKLTYTKPQFGQPPATDYGWQLPDNGDNAVILDWQGLEISLPKKQVTITPSSLADAAKMVEEIRKANTHEKLQALSPEGGLTAQFEPGFITMPEALVAAWSFARGDKTTAAAILFPCFDQTKDDRWIDWATRDLLGNRYHQRMLDKFSLERDYPAALQLAQHLSKPVFDGFNYQDRAKELAAQLPKRMDDFKTFTLPTPDAWTKQKATMTRADQVAFLAAHLRLLNCIQLEQPGGVEYDFPQLPNPASPMTDWRALRKNPPLVNPYTELKNMGLTPADIAVLAPYTIDETYIPTYSYWRNFHPGRTLHRVSWAVGDLINEAAQQTLVDLKELDAMDADGKKQALDKIKAWCAAHEGKSATDLLAEAIRTTKNQDDFLEAANKAVAQKQPALLALAVSRAGDFPKVTANLAQLCVLSGDTGFADQARQWLKANPPAKTPDVSQGMTMQQMDNGQSSDDVRFWSSLILVREGDAARGEGLDALRPYLDQDDGTNYYPRAIPTLLATKNEDLAKLACGVLKKPGIVNSGDAADQLLRLFLAGRPECRDFLLAELKDTSPGGETQVMSGTTGQTAIEHPPASQGIVDVICRWRKDNFRIDESGTPSENLKKRRELANWINTQFALVQQGKPPDMRTDVSNYIPQWQNDAP